MSARSLTRHLAALATLGVACTACAGDDAAATATDGGAGSTDAPATGRIDSGMANGGAGGGATEGGNAASGGDAGSAGGGEPGDADAGPGGDGGAIGDGGTDAGGGSELCDPEPGASADAPTQGPTTYDDVGTTTVSNVIFDGDHSDDLVRVNNGHVVFDHVTFRGTGTGTTGHTLEIKVGGSAEVRHSIFQGAPSEDSLQTEGNGPTVVACNVFATSPGEDHLDTKPGDGVTIRANDFQAPTPGGRTLQNHNGAGRVDLIDNRGLVSVFYEDGATGSLVGNDMPGELWLYDAVDVLVQDNVIGLVKHGEGSSTRDPIDTYFLDNVIDEAQDNGGTCYRDGNTGADPVAFCTSGAPDWYQP